MHVGSDAGAEYGFKRSVKGLSYIRLLQLCFTVPYQATGQATRNTKHTARTTTTHKT